MFTDTENKELIWNLLQEQSKIPLNYQWKQFFEKTINTIASKANEYTNVIEMNKHLISICIQEFEKFSSVTPENTFFQKLKKKQQDLKQLQKGTPPPKIDFTDKTNQEYQNINLEETIAKRQQELNNITKTYKEKEATKWLNSNKVPEIKIDEKSSISIEVKQLPQKTKKVTFASQGAAAPPFQATVASGGDSLPSNFFQKVAIKINYSINNKNKSTIFNLSPNFRLLPATTTPTFSQEIATIQTIEYFKQQQPQ